MSYLLRLSHEVQRTMFNELQYVWHSVGTVQVNVTLLLTHECLIALRFEEFPCTDEVLHHVDIRTCLDIEIACIEESTHVQSRYQFQRFILRVCRCSL